MWGSSDPFPASIPVSAITTSGLIDFSSFFPCSAQTGVVFLCLKAQVHCLVTVLYLPSAPWLAFFFTPTGTEGTLPLSSSLWLEWLHKMHFCTLMNKQKLGQTNGLTSVRLPGHVSSFKHSVSAGLISPPFHVGSTMIKSSGACCCLLLVLCPVCSALFVALKQNHSIWPHIFGPGWLNRNLSLLKSLIN